jgi:O-antigen/teichoic acid export membrane protein
MTGQEAIHSKINIVAVLLQVTLGFILTLKSGIEGAAISFASIMLFSNLAKVFFMYKKVLRIPNTMKE